MYPLVCFRKKLHTLVMLPTRRYGLSMGTGFKGSQASFLHDYKFPYSVSKLQMFKLPYLKVKNR